MKKKSDWHIQVRPSYYRSNFDYDEGPYNRINRGEHDIAREDELVVDEEELEEIKLRDISKKRKQNMKIDFHADKYPDTSKPAPKNEIFTQDESYYKEVYTNRNKELDKVLTRPNGRGLKIIQANASKIATIRGEGVRSCPFGLPMTEACENAGDAIHRLTPLKEVSKDKREEMDRTNKIVYAYHKEGKRCPYADDILKEHNKVNCDFGAIGEGVRSPPITGSPLYPTTFRGVGLDSLYSKPLGFYADNEASRNLFLGLFSILGNSSLDEMIKLADTYDISAEKEKADIMDNLLKKIDNFKVNNLEDFMKIENHIKYINNKYDTIPKLIVDISDALFLPEE